MTGFELIALINSGARPVLTALKNFEDFETCIDEGMRGRIVAVGDQNEDCFYMDVDLNDFENANDLLAKSNYWDKGENGEVEARLTAKEAGFYPKNGIERVYMGYDDEYETYFTLEKDAHVIVTTATQIGVVEDVAGLDYIIVTTTYPSPVPSLLDQPVQMVLPAELGTGVQWVKDNLKAEPTMLTHEDYDTIVTSMLEAYKG